MREMSYRTSKESRATDSQSHTTSPTLYAASLGATFSPISIIFSANTFRSSVISTEDMGVPKTCSNQKQGELIAGRARTSPGGEHHWPGYRNHHRNASAQLSTLASNMQGKRNDQPFHKPVYIVFWITGLLLTLQRHKNLSLLRKLIRLNQNIQFKEFKRSTENYFFCPWGWRKHYEVLSVRIKVTTNLNVVFF